MKNYYIKKSWICFGLLSLLSVNGSYFLLTDQVQSDQKQYSNPVDLPLNLFDESFSYLTLTPKEKKVSVSTYDHWIRAACRRHALDPALVKAVIHAESRFDPQAVSPKGAVGLMQIDPITVRELGIKDPFNPKHNIDGGVRYLKELLETFEGDKKLALAAYNAGPNQVYRHNGVPPFKDTKKYINQVFRYLSYYQNNRTS
ncbi:MAG: lytic transglycosylase domain-containing protein [Deltaproteobacteria bacterium]|nr:lytic transglycosylase domain-containing protein [Deltaproteobacteria bacterium]